MRFAYIFFFVISRDVYVWWRPQLKWETRWLSILLVLFVTMVLINANIQLNVGCARKCRLIFTTGGRINNQLIIIILMGRIYSVGGGGGGQKWGQKKKVEVFFK